MEICKAPTLQLKALNKHTHIMYIEMENVVQKKKIGRKAQDSHLDFYAAPKLCTFFPSEIVIIMLSYI